MKKFYSLLLGFVLATSLSFSQDNTWLKIITHESGLDSARGSRIVAADVNGDNYPDLVWGTGNLNKNTMGIFLNIANPDVNSPVKRVFRDFTAESNINQNRNPEKSGRIVDVSALADVDNDGDLDLVTSIYYHRLQMYQGSADPGDRSEVLLNDGQGHFSIVQNSGLNNMKLVDTLPAGIVNCTGLAYLDYDYDGKIDIYMSTWFSDYAANLAIDNNGYIMRDALLKGNGDGTFTLLKNSGIENVFFPMYGVNITDWNNDGWQDIITSPYCRSGGSLFKNNMNGTFTDVAYQTNYSAQLLGGDHGQALCQWEAQPGDFDNDGDMDLLQINVHGGNDASEGRTHITVNQGAENNFRYEWDIPALKRVAPKSTTHFGDDGGSWIDINADTKLDVLIGQIGYNDAASGTNMQGQTKIYFLKQNNEKTFDDISAQLGFNTILEQGHSIEPCDYDLDGVQEIFVSHQIVDTNIVDGEQVITSYMQIELLENNVAKDSNFISLKLTPPADCNKSAIGSRITVYYDGYQQIREVQAGIGHFAGQQPLIQNFGMSKKQIDSIVVRWPNKSLQTTVIRNPEINTIINVGPTGKTGYIKPNVSNYSLISFETPYISTPNVNIGSTYSFAIKVKNTGNIPFTVNSVSIISENSVFSGNNDVPFVINAGSSKLVYVDFSPLSRTLYNAKIRFNSDATNEQISYVEIKGYGFEPKPMIEVKIDSIIFANAWIDTVRTINLDVTNFGEQDLVFSNFSFENNYDNMLSFVGNAPTTIASGVKQTVVLQFKPTLIQSFATNLIIKSNAYNTPDIVIPVKAICDGPAPVISPNTKSLSFIAVEVGQDKERFLEISNVGNTDLLINSIVLDSLEDIFLIADHASPIVIKKDSLYSLTVSFVPKDDIKHTTNMNIFSNDYLNPKTIIALTGKGKIVGVETDCIDCRDNSFIVDIIPNPAKDKVNLGFKNVKYINNQIYIKIYDMSGRIISNYDFNPSNQESFILPLNLPNLSNGMYYLNIQIGFAIETIPINIQF